MDTLLNDHLFFIIIFANSDVKISWWGSDEDGDYRKREITYQLVYGKYLNLL